VLRSRAETDSLTGLPNRYAMNRKLTHSLTQALTRNTSLGIGLVDIDGFKRYNDLYGHARGDQCLRLVADVLRRVAEAHKIFVARYGGDEFVLIYDNLTNAEIKAIATELQEQMPIKVTHGFHNTVPDETSLPFALLAKADADMYRKRRARRK
jgi:diguanylate cyclase (GGDEF)-like protein